MKRVVHSRGIVQDLHPSLVASKATEREAGGEDLPPLPELLRLRKVPEVGVPGVGKQSTGTSSALVRDLEARWARVFALLTSKAEAFESPGTPVRCLPGRGRFHPAAVAEADLLQCKSKKST